MLAFINLYTQQSKSYFAGYQKYWIIRERQSICCCKNTVLGTKNCGRKIGSQRGGMHTQETSMTHRHVMTWRKRNRHRGKETAWGGSEKKLKALGPTKNALREREGSLVHPVRSSQKYILNITCCKLSPSIPLQTTEVVKRLKISASLAACLHCTSAVTLALTPLRSASTPR